MLKPLKKDVNNQIHLKKKSKPGVLDGVINPIVHEFRIKDILQVIIGAGILAIPVGFTQETWDLGASLPLPNTIGFIVLSVLFIAAFAYYHYHRHHLKEHKNELIKRVLFTYIASFLVVAILMTLIQKAPWQTDWILAFKRVVLVTFPSSMSAAIADTLK